MQCTAERRPRPHRKGRRRRREQSAWEVFLGFLIFFSVACELYREREGGSGEREPSGKAPPESHLRHTLSAVSGPAVPAPPTATALYFPWETFVELQIEVAGKETGAAREWPVRAVLTAT